MTLDQAFDLALAHHQAGRLAEAEHFYRQILAVAPGHCDALHLLGVIASQAGRHDVAVDLIRQAIALAPDTPSYHANLGLILGKRGERQAAVEALRRALALDPASAEAHSNLGAELAELGELDEAIAAHRRAIQLRPDSAPVHNNLGAALVKRRHFDEAIAAYQRALQFAPNDAETLNNLGAAWRERGCLVEAFDAIAQALRRKPDFAEAHNNLGIVLLDQNRISEASAHHHRAVELKPDYPEGQHNLAVVLTVQGKLEEAIRACRRALELKPDYVQAHSSLGNALKDQGRVEEAVAAYRRALEIQPALAKAHDNLLLALHALPSISATEMFHEHRRWNEAHAQPPAHEIVPHRHEVNPARRLRIGYISPDFRAHSVAFFFEGLLTHHDPEAVEVFCYADLLHPDAVTARLREKAACWRELTGMPDREAADLIREDRIDILVDLAGHTAGNRLPMLARKLAPVQVSYLGYCGTTGMDAIDYRLTDAHADPPGKTEQFHSEQLVRLPDCAWCFRPPAEAPPVSAAPCLNAGTITFGSFNSLPKMSGEVLGLWAKILQALPGSRLRLKNLAFHDPAAARRTRDALEKLGIAPDRVELSEATTTLAQHLTAYGAVDIALDTFPYHGTTTTCEALWMGVPVVTLAGTTHASRVGVSLLTTVGLPELIAENEADYLRIAVELATDAPRLAALRATLRERMARSPLMDAPRYARSVEAAYREMWQRWCARQPLHP